VAGNASLSETPRSNCSLTIPRWLRCDRLPRLASSFQIRRSSSPALVAVSRRWHSCASDFNRIRGEKNIGEWAVHRLGVGQEAGDKLKSIFHQTEPSHKHPLTAIGSRLQEFQWMRRARSPRSAANEHPTV